MEVPSLFYFTHLLTEFLTLRPLKLDNYRSAKSAEKLLANFALFVLAYFARINREISSTLYLIFITENPFVTVRNEAEIRALSSLRFLFLALKDLKKRYKLVTDT